MIKKKPKDLRKKEWLLMIKHTQLFLYLVTALIVMGIIILLLI
jgi:hypothetical protein|tara:strand:- start:545 stop:673 length:129 start_codon:yes stop_codon:yes gene_type:complete